MRHTVKRFIICFLHIQDLYDIIFIFLFSFILCLGKDNKGSVQLIVKLKDLRQGRFQLRWEYNK